MKMFLLVAFTLFLFSCKDKKTYYIYKGVAITRIDGNAESTFYYGKIEDGTTGRPFIKAEYQGFNNGLDVLIHFKTDSMVEVIHFGGEYLTASIPSEKRMYIGEHPNDRTDWNKMLRYINLVRLSDSPDLEREWHKMFKSEVIVQKP